MEEELDIAQLFLRELGSDRFDAWLEEKILASRPGQTLKIATWNLQGWGLTDPDSNTEPIIAKVINRFDIVVLTHPGQFWDDPGYVMQLLGKQWGLISPTPKDRPSRVRPPVVVYNSEKTSGTIVKSDLAPMPDDAVEGWRRMPYVCSFESSEHKFAIVPIHLSSGFDQKKSKPRHDVEILTLAEGAKAWHESNRTDYPNLLVLGTHYAKGEDLSVLEESGLYLVQPDSHEIGTGFRGLPGLDGIFASGDTIEELIGPGGVLNFIEILPKDISELDTKAISTLKKEFTDRLPVWVELNPGATSSRSVIAGFSADNVKGPDLLGISKEMETLCRVIAAKEVTPPMSIGLFGEWGAGKSFFISQMQQYLKKLQERSQDDPDKSPYVNRILEIEFNAWHYIDGNLWASLAAHLFEALAKSITGQTGDEITDEYRAKRRDLLREMDVAKHQLSRLENEKSRLESDLEEIPQIEPLKEEIAAHQDTINEIEEDRYSIAKHFGEWAKNDPKLKQDFDNVWKVLSGKDETPSAPDALESMDQLVATYTRTKRFFRWLGHKRGRVLGFIASSIVASACLYVFSLDHWLLQILGVALDVFWSKAVAVIAGLAVILPWASKISTALSTFTKASDRFREHRIRRAADLGREVDRKKGDLSILESQRTELVASINSMEDKLDGVSDIKNIEQLLLERVGSGQYTQHLGIIHMVRKDLNALRDLLAPEKKMELPNGTTVTGRDHRIILYIDDLDRCPPERVVEVLQAVHLLVGEDPFVVVVAADPRWLLKCLSRHYSNLLTSEGPADEPSSEDSFAWKSTPQDYLDKIFQVPFSVPLMDKDGYKRLISKCIGPTKITVPIVDDQKPPVGDDGSTAQDKPAGEKPPTADTGATPPHVEPPSLELEVESLSVEAWEVEFMKKLSKFIRTPRLTKRLANVYRLIRASRSTGSDLKKFKGDAKHGEYQVVQLQLAILYGYPEIAHHFFRGLVETKHSALTVFLSDLVPLSPNKTTGTWNNAACNKIGDDEIKLWVRLIKHVEEILPELSSKNHACEPFKNLAPEVVRYSFRAAHELRLLIDD